MTFRSHVFSLAHRSGVSLDLLGKLGSLRRLQCRTFSGSPKGKQNKLKCTISSTEMPQDSSTRSWKSYIVPAGLLLFAAGLRYYNDECRAIKIGTERVRTTTCKGPAIGGPFSLIDTKHHRITQHDLLGSWVLLYFGYTSSPDIGPAEVEKMAKAVDMIESEQKLKVLPVFVTIDPQRDSPSQLQAYLKEFDPRIVGLSGSVCAIRQMAQEYRVFFKRIEEIGDDYLVQTSHNMYLLDPDMQTVRCFGLEYDAEELSKEILKELNKPSK